MFSSASPAGRLTSSNFVCQWIEIKLLLIFVLNFIFNFMRLSLVKTFLFQLVTNGAFLNFQLIVLLLNKPYWRVFLMFDIFVGSINFSLHFGNKFVLFLPFMTVIQFIFNYLNIFRRVSWIVAIWNHLTLLTSSNMFLFLFENQLFL
jgi:hypothetical protein